MNSGSNRIQITLRYGFPFADTCKYVVDMLPQLASAPGDARARRAGERSQSCSQRGLDQPRQFGEEHKVTIRAQGLHWLIEGPFVQRVDEVQGRMTSAPLEGVDSIAHFRSCLIAAASLS